MNEIDHSYWYMSRAAGLVAYLLLFLSVSLGLALTADVTTRWVRRYRIYDLHRFVTLLALAGAFFHALIVLPDAYFSFSLAELLVPFASPYRPLFMALGVLGLYLFVLVVASFYLRRLISYRLWRLIHYSTFLLFVLCLAHSIGAGTDTHAAWARYMYIATGLITFNLVVYRALLGSARGLTELVDTRTPH